MAIPNIYNMSKPQIESLVRHMQEVNQEAHKTIKTQTQALGKKRQEIEQLKVSLREAISIANKAKDAVGKFMVQQNEGGLLSFYPLLAFEREQKEFQPSIQDWGKFAEIKNELAKEKSKVYGLQQGNQFLLRELDRKNERLERYEGSGDIEATREELIQANQKLQKDLHIEKRRNQELSSSIKGDINRIVELENCLRAVKTEVNKVRPYMFGRPVGNPGTPPDDNFGE